MGELSENYGVKLNRSNNTTIIIGDVMYFGISEDNMLILLKCICEISRKYNLSWKLKKCQWFPKKVEFVGVDISVDGNMPAQSKFGMLIVWKYPSKPREIISFIGFAIFYFRWIPYFEMKVSPL